MKKISALLFGAMCVVLSGLCAYTVFATVSTTLTAQNRIIFEAGQDVFFLATVEVRYASDEEFIFKKTINHTGVVGEHQEPADPGEIDDFALSIDQPITLTTSKRTIWYDFKIENYSEVPITITLTCLAEINVPFLTNQILPAGSVTIPARTLGEEPPFETVRMESTLKSVSTSFSECDNDLKVIINRAS